MRWKFQRRKLLNIPCQIELQREREIAFTYSYQDNVTATTQKPANYSEPFKTSYIIVALRVSQRQLRCTDNQNIPDDLAAAYRHAHAAAAASKSAHPRGCECVYTYYYPAAPKRVSKNRAWNFENFVYSPGSFGIYVIYRDVTSKIETKKLS